MWRLIRAIIVIVLVILVLPYLLVPFYRAGHPVSTLMLARWATGRPVERHWLDLKSISPFLPLTVMGSEDSGFCNHNGIDWDAMQDAIDDTEAGEAARGGSTITQQTAKNLFLWPGRSFVRKALEAPLALWINLVLPKQRVLEIYLNIAEWGPNGEFGAEAGARRAFGRSVRDLSPQEAALMATMLPDPIHRTAGTPGPGLRRLAGVYQRRSAIPGIDNCLRGRR
jgi:monofunctional biosynthetic peptidoglycan transglycosylase